MSDVFLAAAVGVLCAALAYVSGVSAALALVIAVAMVMLTMSTLHLSAIRWNGRR